MNRKLGFQMLFYLVDPSVLLHCVSAATDEELFSLAIDLVGAQNLPSIMININNLTPQTL